MVLGNAALTAFILATEALRAYMENERLQGMTPEEVMQELAKSDSRFREAVAGWEASKAQPPRPDA